MLPELTDGQKDAAILVRAIEILDRLEDTRISLLVSVYLKRIALRLANT